MKIPTKINLKTVAIIVCLTILLTSGFLFYTFAQTPSSTFVISGGVYSGAPSFTIWREGSNYFAKDANGQLRYSGTNASNIIQNCLDTTGVAGGGLIFIRQDEYVLDTTIIIRYKRLTLIGENGGGTNLTLANSVNDDMFFMNQSNSATFFQLRDLRLNGNRDNNNAGDGVQIDYTADVLIDHCFIYNFKDNSVNAVSSWGLQIRNSHLEGSKRGLNGNRPWQWFLSHTTFNYNDDEGIRISGGGATWRGALIIDACSIVENGYHGISLYAGDSDIRDVVITGCNIRGNSLNISNTFHGIKLDRAGSYNVENFTITNNIIDGKGMHSGVSTLSQDAGIRIIDSNYGTIANNVLVNNVDNVDIGGTCVGLRFSNNIGFITENSGGASGAGTPIAVNHGLSGKPTCLIITSNSTDYGDIWVSNIGSTSFSINYDAGGAGDEYFFWYAEYNP